MDASLAAADEAHRRVLGDELRKARKAHGWTRKELAARLGRIVSLQTLATYELGTRGMTTTRLSQLCDAMDELPHEVLERVHHRLHQRDPLGRLVVDLDRVGRDQQPELAPLRRWAHERLDHADGPRPHTVHLDLAALANLAELCDLPITDLITTLRALNDDDELAASANSTTGTAR